VKSRRLAPALEILASLAVLLACAWLGAATGWKGPPKTAISTRVWPFYLDTWFPWPVWTWRALVPLAALPPLVYAVRRWLRAGRPLDLALVLVCVWAVELGCGIVRHGADLGLQYTLMRGQEYWNDVRWVHAGFLARYPEVGGPLSQHGATHPPGLILVLAAVQAIGARGRIAAEIVCSLAAPLTALPLYGAARRLSDEDSARYAVPLFLTACSVTAFAVLAMDLVTMLLAALALYGFARALDGDRAGGVVWGLALGAASLCNFIALVGALATGVILVERRRRLDRAKLTALAIGPLAFFAFYALLVFGFGYRPIHVLQANWHALLSSDDIHRSRAVSLFGSPIAFLGALGLPLMGLTARAIAGAVRRALRREDLATSALLLGAALPPALSIALGKPRGEVEHVFLLFIPLLLIGAATAARRWYARTPRWVELTVALLVVQSVAVEVLCDTFW
jgi:hypothetical protein